MMEKPSKKRKQLDCIFFLGKIMGGPDKVIGLDNIIWWLLVQVAKPQHCTGKIIIYQESSWHNSEVQNENKT